MLMKNLLILKSIPTLLNRLYVPIIRNAKPSIMKSKDGKESTKLIQMEAMRGPKDLAH